MLAFQINLWQNITPSDRCGGCHHAGGQSPMFARSDDVNLAYQAALPLVNLTNPSKSTLVLKVGGGHNCWVADPSACAATMLVWIQNWIGAGSSSTSSVKLVAPPVQAAGGGKQFPADPTAGNPSFQNRLSAADDVLLRLPQRELRHPAAAVLRELESRRGLRRGAAEDQSRRRPTCRASTSAWRMTCTTAGPTSPGGAPDCPGQRCTGCSRQLTAFANGIPVTPIDPTLVVSNALTLTQGTIAAGGSRYDANVDRDVHVRDRPGQHRL